MTTLVRWEPFRELASLQSEMGRLMNGLLEGPGRVTQSWVPALDVWETESEVVYAFDLPGIPEEAISIPPRSRGKADTLVRPITAFGITKNIADWSRDRRCKVATTVIGRRIARGIPPEVAIATPPYGLPRSPPRE